jgi:Family of unknown function (DUF6886)
MTTDRDIQVLTESANPEPSSSDATDAESDTPTDVGYVFHYSEDGTIRRFAPHVPQTNPGQPASVWAIDASHSPLYWFPRWCPRISVWARDEAEQAAFTELLESEASRIVAAQTDWMERVRDGKLYRYVFDAAAFEPWGEADGQYVAHDVVYPERVELLDDLLALHAAAAVEVRFTPRLGALMDRILESGLPFSFVRIRDAKR